MSGELIRMVSGEVKPTWGDRQRVRAARAIRDEVQLAEFKAAGAMALAAKIMQGAVELDNLRRQLVGDDPARDMMLSQFQAAAFARVTSIQLGLFSDFGL